MGLIPSTEETSREMARAEAVYILSADPVGDMTAEVTEDTFLIVQELFHTKTVEKANVIFPARSFLERDGTYTSGERVVQRFYPAVSPLGESLPDWQILARVGEKLDIQLVGSTAAEVMMKISEAVEDYSDINYHSLFHTKLQWPHVGDDDLYFGGTAYKNEQGIGIHLKSGAERGDEFKLRWTAPEEKVGSDGLLIVPITRLLDNGTTVLPSELLSNRLERATAWMNPEDLTQLGVEEGAGVNVRWNGHVFHLPASGEDAVPAGTVLIARSIGVPLHTPTSGVITPASE
jgi:NADH-quinone oxidoreductase subunit G